MRGKRLRPRGSGAEACGAGAGGRKPTAWVCAQSRESYQRPRDKHEEDRSGATSIGLHRRPGSAQRSLLTPAPPGPSCSTFIGEAKEEKEVRASLSTNETVPLGPEIKTLEFTLFPLDQMSLKNISIAHTLSE